MNKRINFEDTIFILTVRIKMIKDLLRLDVDSELFYRQTMGDLDFISGILDVMTEKFLANLKFLDRETEGDNLLDIEWQFSQLLNEITNNSCPYSQASFSETYTLIEKLKNDNSKRIKQLEESSVSSGDHSTSEPVVSNAELNGLLGN